MRSVPGHSCRLACAAGGHRAADLQARPGAARVRGALLRPIAPVQMVGAGLGRRPWHGVCFWGGPCVGCPGRRPRTQDGRGGGIWPAGRGGFHTPRQTATIHGVLDRRGWSGSRLTDTSAVSRDARSMQPSSAGCSRCPRPGSTRSATETPLLARRSSRFVARAARTTRSAEAPTDVRWSASRCEVGAFASGVGV